MTSPQPLAPPNDTTDSTDRAVWSHPAGEMEEAKVPPGDRDRSRGRGDRLADDGPVFESGKAGSESEGSEASRTKAIETEVGPDRLHARIADLVRNLPLTDLDERLGGEISAALDTFDRTTGPVVVMLGGARHGKSVLLRRWNDRHLGRGYPVEDRKTVNRFILDVVTTPWRTLGVIDLAGDKLESIVPVLGAGLEFRPEAVPYIEHILHPAFARAKGLLLTINFPLLWAEMNATLRETLSDDPPPDEVEAHHQVLQQQADLEQAFRCLLRLATHAQDPRRRRMPVPSARELFMEDAVQARLRIPVFIALTKADLYHLGGSPILAPHADSVLEERFIEPAEAIDPEMRSPASVVATQMPRLWEDLRSHVRHFTVQYLQSVDGHSDPNPVSYSSPAGRPERLGSARGFGALDEFFAIHPWKIPGLTSRSAYRGLLRHREWDDVSEAGTPQTD